MTTLFFLNLSSMKIALAEYATEIKKISVSKGHETDQARVYSGKQTKI